MEKEIMEEIRYKQGFTLIELIVVIAILGILMLILVPSFLGYADDAKEQVAQANARTAYTAYHAAKAKAGYGGTLSGGTIKGEIESKLGNGFTVTITTDAGVDKSLEVVTSKTCTINLNTGTFNASCS